MRTTPALAATATLAWILTGLSGCALPALPDQGKVQVDRWAEIKADDKDVAAILAAFNRAEEALHAKDLNGLLALYSERYRYHGLTKSDLKTIWQQLFEQYDQIASTHIFSSVRVTGSGSAPRAEIACTGSLWGLSKETGKRGILDSWFYETHHLAYEDGEWRIIGHAGGDTKALPFGVSPHPFF